MLLFRRGRLADKGPAHGLCSSSYQLRAATRSMPRRCLGEPEAASRSGAGEGRIVTLRPQPKSKKSASMPSPKMTPPSLISEYTVTDPPSTTAAVIDAPKPGAGNASRTNKTSWCDSGVIWRSTLRSREIERAQPVAPVPVAMIIPSNGVSCPDISRIFAIRDCKGRRAQS